MLADPFVDPPPGARPARRGSRRRGARWTAFLVLGSVLGLILAAGSVVWASSSDGPKKAEAQRYLDDLNTGNLAAAYQEWCPQDRAQFSLAQFRAQRHYRIGEHGRVGGFFAVSGNEVGYRTDRGGGEADLARVGGRWYICPSQRQLPDALANCPCMSPSEHLEADIAAIIQAHRMTPPLSAVNCPR